MEQVSASLQGGLGNYMFQIACAHAYGLKYNKTPVFSINDSVVVHKHISRYSDNIFSKINLVPEKNFSDFKRFGETGFNYHEIPSIEGNVYLNGYFQSEKYFKEYEKEIRELFEQPTAIKGVITHDAWNDHGVYINVAENTCSIHVRRGDYLNSPNHHPSQNMNYYMRAIKQMPKDTVFLIFSDDIAWCKQNFPDLPEKFKFIDGSNDFLDFEMMKTCKNNIICNSSFSWWAAWLNNNPNKKVIVPSNWFGPAYSHYNTEDLYCENWIRL